MFIQLDLDEMFEVETPKNGSHVEYLSQFSEASMKGKPTQQRKPVHYQLNSSDLFRESSTGSGSGEPAASAAETFPSVATDPPSQFDMPGERLYYQYQHNLVRKLKDQERFKYELSQQEKNQLTFTPNINKNTNRILASRHENPYAAQRAQERKQQKLKEIEFMEKQKNFEYEKECTFKPKIAKKTEELTRNRSDNVFNNLYREGHRRDIRLMVKKGDQPQTQKIPDAPKLVQDFLYRNDQFIQKTQKKLKMLEEEASQYDLNSGEKLFTPKISKLNFRGDLSRTGAIFNKHGSLHNLNSKLREKVENGKELGQVFTPIERYEEDDPDKPQPFNTKGFSDYPNQNLSDYDQSNPPQHHLEGPDLDACFESS